MQSQGIGKILLNYAKDKRNKLYLNVYQKNARAISFYKREGFEIQHSGLDEATGEKGYSLHHLTDAQRSDFLLDLRNYLKENGKIIIGDVAFETRKDLEQCKLKAGDTWDNDEIYFVVEELRKDFPDLSFTQMSDCAGVLILD